MLNFASIKTDTLFWNLQETVFDPKIYEGRVEIPFEALHFSGGKRKSPVVTDCFLDSQSVLERQPAAQINPASTGSTS